jgi:hypothetical protein
VGVVSAVETLSLEMSDPPATSVMLVLLSDSVRLGEDAGEATALRFTVPEKPLRLESVIFDELEEPPGKTNGVFGVAEILKAVTANPKDVTRVTPPSVPVTLIVNEPAGVEDRVLMVSALVKVGAPVAGLKEHEAPEGRPLAQERLIDCDVPFDSEAVMLLEAALPADRVMLPEFDNEKSKWRAI